MALYFSRDTKVYLEWENGGSPSGFLWEIPVLDGFSFSQTTNSTEITLTEATTNSGTSSRRGSRLFNDSLAPVEWSFTTYMRPFISAGASPGAAGGDISNAARHGMVEEALWVAFLSRAAYNSPATTNPWSPTTAISPDTTSFLANFSDSNRPELGTFRLSFSMDDDAATRQVYRIESCVVTSATIDFDIEGIATIQWSGFGSSISDQGTTSPQNSGAVMTEAIASTNTFIKHRLTEMTIVPAGAGYNADFNNIVLTGGNITFENNITYLTPEEIGTVNQPIGHVTGARKVSGSFTAYFDTAADAMGDLYEDMLNDLTTVQNEFNLTFYIGGQTATPRVEVNIPKAHFEVPTHQIEDVVAMEVNFQGLGTDITTADEATVEYYGIAHNG